MSCQVLFGDFSGSLLEVLNAVSRDVMLPLLTSPTTKNQWPDALSSQVTDSLSKFVANGAHCCLPPALRTFASLQLCLRVRFSWDLLV